MNREPILDHVKKGYSDPTWWYDVRGFFILHLCYQTTLWPQIKFFERNMSARHLEVGVGSGTLLSLILCLKKLKKKQNPQIVGVDYVENMVNSAKMKFIRNKKVLIQQGDVTDLKFPNQSFDSVSIANAFHCFHDPQRGLKEIYRVLVPNGTLAVNVLLHPRGSVLSRKIADAIVTWGQKKGILYKVYDITELRTMVLSSGFTIREEVIWGNTVNFLITKPVAAIT